MPPTVTNASKLEEEEWVLVDEDEIGRDGHEPLPPRIIKGCRSSVIQEGDTVVLYCEVESEPIATFSWYLDDEELKPSDRVTMEIGSNWTKLTVKNAKKGFYTARAKNPYGAATSTAYIRIRSELISSLRSLKFSYMTDSSFSSR